jgi:hypothetical protein
MQLGLFQPTEVQLQLCEACHREIAVGDGFCKESTQSLDQRGRLTEVDIKIYHEECCNENGD